MVGGQAVAGWAADFSGAGSAENAAAPSTVGTIQSESGRRHVEGNPGGPAAGPGVPSFAGRPVAGRIAGCPQNLDRQKKDGRLGLGAYQAVML